MKQLSEQDIYERYAERAAIMQIDGGMSYEAASQFFAQESDLQFLDDVWSGTR